MFKEVLKILPRLDQSELQKMERTLSQRFGRVAKKFGKGLMTTLKGGGVLGAITFLAGKLLNPLKEVQEAIDRSLASADTLATNAKEFNTTAGKLFKLQQLARATGLDENTLNEAITKFQVKLAEAEADPRKETSVRAFVGQKDIAEAFFQFVQGLQVASSKDKTLAMQEVFGDARKQVKFFDFLQQDFGQLFKDLGVKGAETYTPAIESISKVSDLTDLLAARRNIEDIRRKAQVITPEIARQKDRQERIKLEQENNRIASYSSIMEMEIMMGKLQNNVEQGFLKVTEFIPILVNHLETLGSWLGKVYFQISEMVSKISKMSLSRGIRGLFGGGE